MAIHRINENGGDIRRARQFLSKEQYEEWVLNRYEPYAQTIPKFERSKLIGLEASNHGREERAKEYDILDRCFRDASYPKIEEDTVAWRSFREFETREYISCSVFEDIAENYGNPIKIILKKGSPVLPLRALHYYCGASQGELIIKTARLQRDESDRFYYV